MISFEIARAVIQTIITLGVGVWFIVCFAIYSPKKDNPSRPECKKPIHVWLLVMGITQIVFLGISLLATFCCRIGVKETSVVKKKGGCGTLLVTILTCLILLWIFVWWIVGQAWTFSIKSFQCNETVYLTAFWYLIVTYILIGIGIIIAILVCCCGTAIFKKQRTMKYEIDF